MKKCLFLFACLLFTLSAFAQGKRLWVLRSSGEMVEYDPATFATKQTVKLPPDALKTLAGVQVNRSGQIVFAPPVSLPLAEEDAAAAHKLWIWNGHAASTIDVDVERKEEKAGSNDAIAESAPTAYLSAD